MVPCGSVRLGLRAQPVLRPELHVGRARHDLATSSCRRGRKGGSIAVERLSTAVVVIEVIVVVVSIIAFPVAVATRRDEG